MPDFPSFINEILCRWYRFNSLLGAGVWFTANKIYSVPLYPLSAKSPKKSLQPQPGGLTSLSGAHDLAARVGSGNM